MSLSETIQTRADMVNTCRLRLDDLEDHYFEPGGELIDDTNLLWKNAELNLYANEAVREVAFRTLSLRDCSLTANFTTFGIDEADDGWITFSDAWLQFHRITWTNDTTGEITRLERVMHRRLDREITDWQEKTSDAPTNFILSESSRKIRIYPLIDVAANAGTLRLEGARLPSSDMTADTDSGNIWKQYKNGVVNWMCHMAYLKNDADAKDQRQSDYFAKLFDEEFGPRPTKHQAEQRLYAAQSHRPTIYYR